MNYQLVIQYPQSAFSDIDSLTEFENSIIEAFGDQNDFDGHDIGSGEVNFFIFTSNPKEAFLHAKKQLLSIDCSKMKAAYRHVESDTYNVIWPLEHSGPFQLT